MAFGETRCQAVDVRQPVALGEHARDALRLGEAFVDQRLRERAAAGAVAGGSQAVGLDEPRRFEQVGDELGELVDVVGALKPRAAIGGGRILQGPDGLLVHVPRLRYRRGAPTP